MANHFDLSNYDLVTPDGIITKITGRTEDAFEATIFIENISPSFVGFEIEKEKVCFNLKSTLAQVGMNAIGKEFELDSKARSAEVRVEMTGIGKIGKKMTSLLQEGAFVGKLFAADERRRVREPFYLHRMFGRSDRWGRPLLSLGGMHGSSDLVLDVVDGRTVAYLTLQKGRVLYDDSIHGFLTTLAKGLLSDISMRELLKLHQVWKPHVPHNIEEGEMLVVKTLPLHIRTVFAKVVDDLLSDGYRHTSASVLQPDTHASGDIYELYGNSKRELTDIPLEFYTLEPYREHVFFQDRDQLQSCLEDPAALFKAFETAPSGKGVKAAVFIVKGEQILKLAKNDWIKREPRIHEFPGPSHGDRQALMVERYIQQQPSYPLLKSIDEGKITSQGILLTRYFPSPLMKRMLLSDQVQRMLKGIYFEQPSLSSQQFFSAEDRSLLNDLYKFAIPVYWVDNKTQKILQYTQKPDRDTGMFIPLEQVERFLKATVFGIYGSNLLSPLFEEELRELLKGILDMRKEVSHPLLNAETPLTLVTGGGPGAMEVGNRLAKELEILSCANIVDFRQKDESVVNEQKENPYVEGKMTYKLDKLVERQAEFNLDFPIFLTGGIGTDFEYTLEEVRRKVGAVSPTPVILLGDPEHWKRKVSSRFACNLESGTIAGSEWVSNCFYSVSNAKQALDIYRAYFEGKLPIGKSAPFYEEGLVVVEDTL